MFASLGRYVVKHPWQVIAAWIVAAIAIVSLAPSLPNSSDESDFLPRHYESIKAADIQQSAFPAAFTPSMIAVFQREDGKPLTAADSAKINSFAAQLSGKKIENIQQVIPAPPSPKKLVQTLLFKTPEQTQSNYQKLNDSAQQVRDALGPMVKGSDLKVGTTGSLAQSLDQQKASGNSDAIIGIATILLIIVLLLVIFRSPIIAFLPIVLIGIVSQVANGLIGFAAKGFGLKADSSINQLLIVVLFGVGTDYILFLMFRYRERLRAGEDPKQAMVSAVTRVGEAIASAAGVVIIAFLAMTLSTLGMLKAMGPSLAIAVAVTLLAGLTLVPAVVSLLGTKVFWPSKAWQHEPTGARYAAIGRSLARRPAMYAGVSGVIMLALAISALGFKPTFDLSGSSMPKTAESVVALQDLERDMPAGATNPTDVFVQADQPLDKAAMASYKDKLAAVDGVGQVADPKYSKDGRTADFSVVLKASPESDAALNTVSGPLRDAAHQNAPPQAKAYVGGITSVYVDIKAAMNRDYAVVFPVAAVLIMIVLGLLLRSLVAPWYLMVSVGLGFLATLGATTLIFQGIQGESGLMFMLPLIMYMFVVALGTDYNILMVARLREEAQEGLSPRDAAAIAIRHAGPTIGAAGLILAGSFGSLMLAGNSLLSSMGFALASGIVMAAFLMATIFTPALTALIGAKAWWPGHQGDTRADAGPGGDELREQVGAPV
ncbi:MMPL family transporter [Flexivirga meconopsidis]|uniref:MMPL family transporter n=1 Tax=Flexivirga meconopsidis TaxID=2977121 RepID=UPI00223FB683|nr:MMPL family transporter [Flexivirga meconopsidis]